MDHNDFKEMLDDYAIACKDVVGNMEWGVSTAKPLAEGRRLSAAICAEHKELLLEIERLRAALESIAVLANIYPNGKTRPVDVAIDIAETVLKGGNDA